MPATAPRCERFSPIRLDFDLMLRRDPSEYPPLKVKILVQSHPYRSVRRDKVSASKWPLFKHPFIHQFLSRSDAIFGHTLSSLEAYSCCFAASSVTNCRDCCSGLLSA